VAFLDAAFRVSAPDRRASRPAAVSVVAETRLATGFMP